MSSRRSCTHHPLYAVLAPLVSLIGGIFVWVGVWDFIIDYLHGATAGFDLLYMSVGLAFLVLTRTLIPQAGLRPVTYFPVTASSAASLPFCFPLLSFLAVSHHPPGSHPCAMYLRSLLALLAGICFWLGTYNLFDLDLFASSLLRDLLYTMAGLLVMFVTSNVSAEGTVIADSADPSVPLPPHLAKSPTIVLTSSPAFVLYYCKALLGLYGDVVYWVGAYNIADVWAWEYSPARDSCYVVVGFAVFFVVSVWTWWDKAVADRMSRVVGPNGDGSGSSDGQLARVALQPASSSTAGHASLTARLSFWTRCLLAMTAGVVFWVGWWNVLSTYVLDSTSAQTPSGENEDDSGLGSQAAAARLHPHSRHVFSLLSLAVAASSPLSGSHAFSLLQRSSQSSSGFPVWLLYVSYCVLGLVLLIVTNTFNSNAGVIQPLSLIRQQAHVGLSAIQDEQQEQSDAGSRQRADGGQEDEDGLSFSPAADAGRGRRQGVYIEVSEPRFTQQMDDQTVASR